MFCFVLFCFVLFCFVFCFVLFCFVLFLFCFVFVFCFLLFVFLLGGGGGGLLSEFYGSLFILVKVLLIFQVGRSVDETLRLVQAFQYTDKHGEVCPAGWKPGKETIIPDPTEKKKYFAKQAEKGDNGEK